MRKNKTVKSTLPKSISFSRLTYERQDLTLLPGAVTQLPFFNKIKAYLFDFLVEFQL